MRNCWLLLLLFATGCTQLPLIPDEPLTQQVGSKPFVDPRPANPVRVAIAPAANDVSYRVLLIKNRLVGENPSLALRPAVIALASGDPEIFHVGLNQIYITDTLVRQCRTDGEIAAVIAYELGRMVVEREASVADEVRRPERPLPIQFNVGSNGSSRDRDPIGHVELAMYEKANPKLQRKIARPNPHLIARDVLERAGYQRTDFDAVWPILQNAERYQVLETQFKGTIRQGDWRTP
ncbi:MAG: hypothetical protein FJ303_26885 [Planctomycetes bacterium]|nr:hypothetical protein [Planctomycetota bacterium]